MAEKLAYNITEAAHALGIGKTSLYELIKAGKLTPQPLAGGVVDKRVIPRSQLEALLAERSPPTPASKHAA
jgi:excisionase family DNA binding protein